MNLGKEKLTRTAPKKRKLAGALCHQWLSTNAMPSLRFVHKSSLSFPKLASVVGVLANAEID